MPVVIHTFFRIGQCPVRDKKLAEFFRGVYIRRQIGVQLLYLVSKRSFYIFETAIMFKTKKTIIVFQGNKNISLLYAKIKYSTNEAGNFQFEYF